MTSKGDVLMVGKSDKPEKSFTLLTTTTALVACTYMSYMLHILSTYNDSQYSCLGSSSVPKGLKSGVLHDDKKIITTIPTSDTKSLHVDKKQTIKASWELL